MKETFTPELKLGKKNLVQLKVINEIIEEYLKQGYKLTLRQLYYQLVSRNIIPNLQKEYAKLSNLLVAGRMAGVVDWEAIEDRIRVPFLPYWVDDVAGALDDTISQYRLNRQDNQKAYIEVWVEKDALSGVLRRITSHYHVNLMVNRGYSSCSAMYDASKRFNNSTSEGKRNIILFLGDHDPSGLDMINDIKKRLFSFGSEVEVIPIALTHKQIEEYNPPPNPTKIKDPRANDYISKYGSTCWEVDALTPQTLNKLVTTTIEKNIDMELFNDKLELETEGKDILTDFKRDHEVEK